jgi:DnaK suppressor protein
MPARAKRPARRSSVLRRLLEQRREVLRAQMKEKLRAVRTAEGVDRGVRDQHEPIDGDGQSEIALAVLQMESDTLRTIDAALERLAQGTYGDCSHCRGPISAERLRALPFAARCKPCEEARERLRTAALSRVAAYGPLPD